LVSGSIIFNLFGNRAGPSVRDDERQRILVFRANVNEVNVSPSISVMNCGRAFSFASILRQVVFRPPIARECLNRRELHALRLIRDGFPIWPPGCVDASAQFGEFRFRNIHLK